MKITNVALVNKLNKINLGLSNKITIIEVLKIYILKNNKNFFIKIKYLKKQKNKWKLKYCNKKKS